MEKLRVTKLDVRIAVSVGICYLSAMLLNELGIRFAYEQKSLEILQTMTCCITCLLCCQDDTKISRKAGVNRMIITAVGGGMGLLVIAADYLINWKGMMPVWIIGGILATLFLCKACKVPYINARIGGVTFILVSCTLTGNVRIWYGLFRFLSTFYGILVVLLVTWLFERFGTRRRVIDSPVS